VNSGSEEPPSNFKASGKKSSDRHPDRRSSAGGVNVNVYIFEPITGAENSFGPERIQVEGVGVDERIDGPMGLDGCGQAVGVPRIAGNYKPGI
jgi:hypothetical protein